MRIHIVLQIKKTAMYPSSFKMFGFSLVLSSSLIKTDSVAVSVAMSGCSQGKCGDSNISFSLGMLVLAPVVVSTWIVWTQQKQKLDYHRLKLFDRNGGNLLKKKLSKRKKSALKIFTAQEMNKVTNNYSDATVMQRCGPGTFYRGSFGTREVVVMKIPTVAKSKVEQFVDEMIFLSQPHRNLVKIIGCCLETCFPLLVYELHGDGNATVFDCLRDEASVPLVSCEHRVKAAAGAARGLAYLHSNPRAARGFAYLHSNPRAAILHGNICSANILLDGDFDAKVFYAVASAGLFKGNSVYRDPIGRLDEKSDVYSFGVVLVELLTRGVALASDRWGDDGDLATWFVSLIEANGLSEVVDDGVMLSEEDGRLVREVAAMVYTLCSSVQLLEKAKSNFYTLSLTNSSRHWLSFCWNESLCFKILLYRVSWIIANIVKHCNVFSLYSLRGDSTF